MRSWGFSRLLLLAGAVTLLVTASGGAALAGSALAQKAIIDPQHEDKAAKTSRKLKVTCYTIFTVRNKGSLAKIDLEDYPCFDPAPSTRETIKAGPIEHGTPLMPYIPQPTPPSHPKLGLLILLQAQELPLKMDKLSRGTPQMPFIPLPIPPSHPEHGSP